MNTDGVYAMRVVALLELVSIHARQQLDAHKHNTHTQTNKHKHKTYILKGTLVCVNKQTQARTYNYAHTHAHLLHTHSAPFQQPDFP